MADLGSDAVALAAELVAIDSVNPGLVPGAAGEAAIVAHLRARLERAGFATTVIGDARPSLVALAPEVPAGPTVVLNGHLDTVGVAGMPAPFEPRIEGERMLGRGAADMKGGIAAMVVAAEHLARTGARTRPVLALVADEEDASIGSEAVIAALPELDIQPDVCLIGEPTDLRPARSLRGFAVVEVEFEGTAAHSSQAHEGDDAIRRLGAFLAAVERRAGSIRAAGGELMVTVVSGGSSPFVVADRAHCIVERRTVPGERASDAVDEVRSLLEPGERATARLLTHREAWRLDDTGQAAELSSALEGHLGTTATFDAPYWMEAPLWQSVAPTVVCGPSGGGLHAVDEWVDVRQVRRFAHALVEVLPMQHVTGAD